MPKNDTIATKRTHRDLMETSLLLIRHAETVWNREARMQGFLDSPLSEAGTEQAQALGRRLKNVTIDALYASDSPRCLRTARIVMDNPSARVVQMPGLRERHLGDWEGRLWSEIKQENADGARLYRTSGDFRPPNGETFHELRNRVLAALVEITQAHPGRRVAVFTSGGAIKAAIVGTMGLPAETWAGFSTGNTGITRLQLKDGVWKVMGANDLSHLAGTRAGKDLF